MLTILERSGKPLKKDAQHFNNKPKMAAMVYLAVFVIGSILSVRLVAWGTGAQPPVRTPMIQVSATANIWPGLGAAPTATHAVYGALPTVKVLAVEPTLVPTLVATSTLVPTQTLVPSPTFDAQILVTIKGYWDVKQKSRTVTGLGLGSIDGVGVACPDGIRLGAAVVLETGQRYICVDRGGLLCRDRICGLILYSSRPVQVGLFPARIDDNGYQVGAK